MINPSNSNDNYTNYSNIMKLKYCKNNILSIYPNPNNGMVKMKMYETTLNDVTVKIYNAIGGLAKTITIKNNDLTEKQIDLSSFASGVYLIQIEAADKVYTHKISVIK